MLSGKKTYLVAGGGVLVVLAYLFGVIDAQQMNVVLGLLGFSGLAALRAGVDKAKGE